MGDASKRIEFWAGLRALVPVTLGVIPFGLIAGVAAVSSGLSPKTGLAMSMFIFAGASQLATIDLLSNDAPFLVILLTAGVINLRFIMYSASIAPFFQSLSLGWKCVLAYLLTDQAYAISLMNFNQREEHQTSRSTPESSQEPSLDEPNPDDTLKHGDRPPSQRHWFYFGGAILMWVVWQMATLVGVLLGTQVPDSWQLDFGLPLTFMAVLIPALKDKISITAAVTAGIVSIVAIATPLNLGLIMAAISGIVVGLLLDLTTHPLHE